MTVASPSVRPTTEGGHELAEKVTVVARVLGGQTDGAFEMYELSLGLATVAYHVHRNMDETLYVVEGEIEFHIAGSRFVRPVGPAAFVPRGVHHGFTNHGPGPARLMCLFTPASNQHEYFRAFESLLAAPTLDPAAVQAMQKRYDHELVTPP